MSSEEEPVAWLRAQVEARLAAAKLAAREGGKWTQDDPVRYPGSISSLGGPVVYDEGSPDEYQAAHIAANDPQDTIARCEAELAILDVHYILTRDDRSEAYEEFSVVSIGGANQDRGCVTCHYYGQGGVKGYGICRTVRLLAGGYRHRPGFPAAFAAVNTR